MSMKNLLRVCGIAVALSLFVTTPAFAQDAPQPAGKWIVYLDGVSDNDGEMVLHFAPAQGDAVDITTRIAKGTRENKAAEVLAGSLKGQLGGGYKVKVEDGEKVYIKVAGKTPKFVLTLGSSTVTGLNIKIKS